MSLRAKFAATVLAAAPLTALIPAATTNAAVPQTVAATTTATAALQFCNAATSIPLGPSWTVGVPALGTRTGGRYESCSLRYGDRYGGVWWLQTALNDCYGFKLAEDGFFGAATRSAVRRVQQIHHITVDGVYGPQTMKAMNWRLTNEYTSSERCYRPLVNRTVAPAPAPGPYSPYCSTATGRYFGNGWYVVLPVTRTRTGSPNFGCYLRQGDRGTGVYQLQHALRDCYKSRLTVDGQYGLQTKAVVQAVQRRHGIKADGIYGPATMRAMYWRLTGHTPPNTNSQKCYSPF